MAVVKMASIEAVGPHSELGQTLLLLEQSGVFHPENISSFYSDTSGFSFLREENPYVSLLRSLERIAPSAKKPAELAELSDEEISDYILGLERKIDSLMSERDALNAKISDNTSYVQTIRHFFGLDINIARLLECEYTHFRFGFLNKEAYEKLGDVCGDDENTVFICATIEGDTVYGVYFSTLEYADEADRIFSGLYFKPVDIRYAEGSSEQIYEMLSKENEKISQRIDEINKELEKIQEDEGEKCLAIKNLLEQKNKSFSLRSYVALYNDRFIICGWVPKDEAKGVQKSLESLESVSVLIEDANTSNGMPTPPTKLKNTKFATPYEFYVDMYGLPSYGEKDPTLFVAITYTLLFGIMFGDVGQGLVLSLIGYLMWKLKNMPLGRILIPCGISSAIFGLVYGSVFGFEHLLDPLYKKIGFAEKPVEVMDVQTTQIIIYGAVAAGAALVAVSMILNIISSIKQKHLGRALFSANGVCGFVFYVSLLVGLVCTMFLGIPLMTVPYIIGLIVIPILLMYFEPVLANIVEKKSKIAPESWPDFLMQSFFELFEAVLGYVTNTMSFLRVGAFVLVHAGMMTVVFTLADMSAGVARIIILILGNGLVMCLEGLLVGIQVLRLEFYEMFSRFFDGAGKAFTPSGKNNK